MPTWYTNTLIILGPSEDIRQFRDVAAATSPKRANRATALSLRSLSPGEDSYRARLSRWGTPWDVQAKLARVDLAIADPKGLEYTFKSAVGSPLPWLRTASGAFPTLQFLLRYTTPTTIGTAVAQAGSGDDVQAHLGRFFRCSTSVRTLAEV